MRSAIIKFSAVSFGVLRMLKASSHVVVGVRWTVPFIGIISRTPVRDAERNNSGEVERIVRVSRTGVIMS